MDPDDERKLIECLNTLIEKVDATISTLTDNTNTDDSLFLNSNRNNNVNTFTIDLNEEELLEKLKDDMEDILKNNLPTLSDRCSNYIEQFLYEYHFNRHERIFTQPFTANILYSFRQNLKGLLMSVKAYPAALRGDLETVKEFIKFYSYYKNKSGMWGTTLLWSAARGGHFKIVKYLIGNAGCYVNAQNQSDITYLLVNDDDAERNDSTPLGYDPDPKAASTALHAACFTNNLEIVEYLISKGADYFIRNQLGETPIQNGKNYPEIQQFFKNYLVTSYVDSSNVILPDATVLNCYNRKPNNCMWEFKLMNKTQWSNFTQYEQSILSNALASVHAHDIQTFETNIYLNVKNNTYPVDLLKFLRGRKNQDPNPAEEDKQAWIRCRGSSIANFDIHCIWQLMFIHYDTKEHLSSLPSLDASTIPSIYDSKFKIKLNSWYTCDSDLNDLFDQAMNYRRKSIEINRNYIGNIKCNLYLFEFSSDNRRTLGYIRWIPKYIANDPNHLTSIKELDNFQSINQFNPIPLTTAQLQLSIQSKSIKNIQRTTDEIDLIDNIPTMEPELDDDAAADDDDDIQPNSSQTNGGTWTLNTLLNNNFVGERETLELFSPNDSTDDQITPAKNLVEEISIRHLSENENRSQQQSAAHQARFILQNENEQLKTQIISLQRQLDEQRRNLNAATAESQQIMNQTLEALENTQKQLNKKDEHEKLIDQISKQISIREYKLRITNNSLLSLWNLIFKRLKSLDYQYKKYFRDTVPMMNFQGQNESILLLKGFPVHHKRLEDIFDCLKDLFHQIYLAQTTYQQEMNRSKQSILKTIDKVHPTNSIYWKSYQTSLLKLIRNKYSEHVERFQKYLKDQTITFMNQCVENSSSRFHTNIQHLTNNYIKNETFISDIDLLKVTALHEFIHYHVLSPQKSFKTAPTKQSIFAFNKHIDKIKKLLTTAAYKGCELNKFQMIAPLLQRIMIYYNCFLLQLPLFDGSIDLLNKVEQNTVITIETSTGSGKSTLVPALLIAEGYDKILVTQPRRLPCQSISKRVNSMVNDKISGWAVSGVNENVHAKIIYLTDGLLKERLLNDKKFITKNTKLNKGVIFFIDEVHERSINIDLCLALFVRLLKLNPQLQTKIKVIISSATLDKSVPTLYKNLPNCSYTEFNLQLSTLYPVKFHRVPHENILDLVQKLYSKRIRNEQILCFVPSTQDVHENCDLLKKMTKGAVVAYPLIQSQSAREQEKFIQEGTVFFSTTVAETSLTFPYLKYVVDTGLINMPVYDLKLERTVLKEIKAAQSTTKQRLGRLGRTQPGEYYALYDYKQNEQEEYPNPQIYQTDLVNIEFSLRKSQLQTTLKTFKQYLPKQPKEEYIDNAIKQLKLLELLNYQGDFTDLGKALAELPDFGSLQMCKAVYYALKTYHCGRDLVILSSILSVVNTSSILKSIPINFKCPEGDFMTLLNVMQTVLSAQDTAKHAKFNLDRTCNAKGLSSCAHIIKRALQRYKKLAEALNLSEKSRDNALASTSDWQNIARALIKGYSKNIFVSLKILQGRAEQYIRYNIDQHTSDGELTKAVIDRSSILRTKNKGVIPASLILARDVRYLSTIRSTAVLSFVGKIDFTWLEYNFKREFFLSKAEQDTYNIKRISPEVQQKFPFVTVGLNNDKLIIHGQSSHVLQVELHIRQQLVTTKKFTLSSNQAHDNLARNLKSITKMPMDVFGPLRWRWENEQQVKVRTKMNQKQGTIDVTVEGLESQNQAVEKEFMNFLKWLRSCAVIRDPHAGVAPRVLKQPLRSEMYDMEIRISHITDPDLTSVDIWKYLKGPEATRETRMEVVAWVAVCLYDCRLEGGFIRDWIVGHYLSKPQNLPVNQWITFDSYNGLPVLDKRVVPSDLDIHLPATKQFDIEAFIDKLYSYGMSAKKYRQDWRYVLLIDQNYKTGPFIVDLIEPHVALTHDRIDFDVGNLSLEKSYTKDLGMRVDITGGTHPMQLETIVENIRKKRFQVLRPIDGENGPNTKGTVAERIEKLKARGWTQIGEPWSFIPNPPPQYNAILVPYPQTTILYTNIVTAIKKISGARDIKIEQIKNSAIEHLYEYMKRTIERECPQKDANEAELYHGTSGEAIYGITQRGYDDRYYSDEGAWGRGAYFADDPCKSHKYTKPDPKTNQRVIFYNKVILGIESVQTTTNTGLNAAPLGYHSVHGAGGWPGFQFHEYIVYRYGQALPYLKITYRT